MIVVVFVSLLTSLPFNRIYSVAQAYDRNRTLHQLLYQVPDRSRFPPGTDILTQNAFYDPTHNNINVL